MDYRTLEITIQYAEDLNKVNFISKMDVYVVVSISGGDGSSKQKIKTAVDQGGDTNPAWSFPMKFTVEEAALLQNRLTVDIEIRCERTLGDRVIGEVHVPAKELLDFPATAKGRGAKNFVSYQVKKPCGKPKGKLTFSYQFRGKTATSAAQPESKIAYPVVEPSSPYLLMAAAGGYSPELTSPYPPPPLGLYPPIVPPQLGADFGGQYPRPPGYMIKPECYPPLPSPSPYCVGLPQGHFGHPPPVMQLAPDWCIVDWRYYDTPRTGF